MIHFRAATSDDDAAVRRLLREQSMGGSVRLALEREPEAGIAAAIEGDRNRTVVGCRSQDGRVVAFGTRATRLVWVNGRPARMGYLAQLRRDSTVGRRRQTLIDGFAAVRAHRASDELPYDLTSIGVENLAARRLLERAGQYWPSMPYYRPLASYVTMMIPVVRRSGPAATDNATDDDAESLARCINCFNRRHQFAPLWTAEDLRSPLRTRGLQFDDFLIHRSAGTIDACLAVWNQMAFKQTVVRGYRPNLRRFWPLINAWMALRGRPRLPEVGQAVRMAFLSHLGCNGDDFAPLLRLIEQARISTAAAGLDWLVLGLAAGHPLLEVVQQRYRRAGLRTWESVIYLVHDAEATEAIAQLDGRPLHLEVAVL